MGVVYLARDTKLDRDVAARSSRFRKSVGCIIGIAARLEPTPQVPSGAPDGEGARTHHESRGFATTGRNSRRAAGINQLILPGTGITERLNRCRIEFLLGTVTA